MKNLSNTEAELKKTIAYQKCVNITIPFYKALF